MSPLRTAIDEALKKCGPDASLAQVVDCICEGMSYEEYQKLTYPLLVNRVAQARATLKPKPKPRVRVAAPLKPATPVADRAAWMNELILIPGKLSVTWGEATVADHLARIDYLKNLCAANEAQIRKHQQAIDTIRRSHVKCLADVKVRAA